MLKNENIQSILKQEIIATRTYSKMFQEIDLKENSTKLRKILRNHQDAVVYWREQGGEMDSDILEIYQNFNLIKNDDAKTNENQSLFKKLKNLELKELSIYKDLLNSFKLEPSQKSYIKTILLPAQREHLRQIEGISKLDSKQLTEESIDIDSNAFLKSNSA